MFTNQSSPLGNRCFFGQGEEGCTPFHLVLQENGRLQVRTREAGGGGEGGRQWVGGLLAVGGGVVLQVREGVEVGQGKVRWSARGRPSFDWVRQGGRQG